MENKNYRLSMWGGMYGDLTVYEAIDRFIENGFFAMEYPEDFTTDYLKLPREEFLAEAQKIHDYAAIRHFEISQGHLVFKHPFLGDEPLKLLKDNIDFLYTIGVKNMVLHVSCYERGLPLKELREKYYSAQVSRLKELIEHIGERDIVLCLENVLQNANTEKSELILDYIRDCDNSSKLGICLDTGHLNRSNGLEHISQTPAEFIENSAGRIKALHINSNTGKVDQHLFPYSGKEGVLPDWEGFIKALNKSGYSGLFSFEVPGENKQVPLKIRDLKMRYAKELFDLLTDEETFNAGDK